MRWTFTVPLAQRPPTQNTRMHWQARARVTREIRRDVSVISAAERHARKLAPATTRRSLRLAYIRPPREAAHPLDPGAVCEAMKAVIDGLVDGGWFVDDTAALCSLTMPTQERGATRAVRVEVWEA